MLPFKILFLKILQLARQWIKSWEGLEGWEWKERGGKWKKGREGLERKGRGEKEREGSGRSKGRLGWALPHF